MVYIKSLDEKYLKYIKCPKCGWHSAILNTKTGLISCMYCMYRDTPKKDIKDLTDKELEQEIYECVNETHDKRRLQKLKNERLKRWKE